MKNFSNLNYTSGPNQSFIGGGKKFWPKINDFGPKNDPLGSSNHDDRDLTLMFFYTFGQYFISMQYDKNPELLQTEVVHSGTFSQKTGLKESVWEFDDYVFDSIIIHTKLAGIIQFIEKPTMKFCETLQSMSKTSQDSGLKRICWVEKVKRRI